MRIAVVILNWNGRQLLEQFLPSIVKYSADAEIFVADNASTDDSVAFVQANFKLVKIIQNKRNYGFAQGYNEALTHIEADIFALVNSDIEVTENWLAPIIETFKNEPNTAVIQPKIKDFKSKELFEYAGAAGGFIDKYGYPFCRGRIFETIETDQGQYDGNAEIFWASGACFFVRSEVFRSMNGFDVDFFAHQEEIDLCWRIFNAKMNIKYVAESTVYHVGGATLEQGNPHKTYLNFRNSLMMLVKNLPKQSLYKVLFMRMVLDGVAAVRFLLNGNGKHFIAILNAHGAFYQSFKRNYAKRQTMQRPDYYKINSVVFAYFWHRKQKFSDLF